ncbi:O-antigen ligase family protein [Undibacterium squillarum]|uniref:O-antigen ligase-related domain-containing protein n=1 Tax=Undibacterium squillarum TaxID=1131567 RepID=A0ABQ2XY57_9BURK|nr:O-antigen ligase family protein [Undibacterium squillarum]GGX36607.1 hypothetical protein GCM10010946_13070 [Undibacterium squillarum]
MAEIIFLVPLIALFFAFRHNAAWLFLYVYLPSLLLFPDTFHTQMTGLPKLSINQAMILGIIPFAIQQYRRFWKWTITDLMVIALMMCMSYSEYAGSNINDARNLTVTMWSAALFPYVLCKLCLLAEDIEIALTRVFVGLMAVVTFICIYEARFGFNPFIALLQPFFPGQGMGWVTTFRYGFARIAGPFAHAILAGIMMAMTYRLHRWLQWGGHWDGHLHLLKRLPWDPAKVLTVLFFLGMVMTVARGPWLGGVAGAMIVFLSRTKNRRRALWILLALVLVCVPALYVGFQSYLDIQPGMKMTMSQESAMYRKVLMEKYIDIAIEHAVFGWGRNTWPKVPGMESIDNYYLLLTLMHGLSTMLLLVVLMLSLSVRLVIRGMKELPGAASLAMTHAGIIVMVAVSLVTVYLGEQVIPAVFLIFGWADACLIRPYRPQDYLPATEAQPEHQVDDSAFPGKRIIQ